MKKSEAAVQQQVLIRASQLNWRLFRNNVGVFIDSRGVPVRYGLANASAQQNKQMKSADLIGIRPVVVTQEMVGKILGVFTSIECKCEGWKPRANDPHEIAQRKWQALVRSLGGYAEFVSDADSIDSDVNNGDTGGTVINEP